MLVYGEVGCRKALGGFQRTNRTAVQFESGKGDVKNSAAAFVFLKCQKLLCTQLSGNTPHQFKKGRMIIMKMKKFLSSLTAGVMAATTILTSALVTPMMSLAATAADDAPIAFLHIQSSDGKWSLNNYKAGTGTDVTIDKSGSYEVSVKRGDWGDALSSYNFFDLCVQDPDLYDGKSLYKKITIDSVKIGETTHELNQEYTTFTPSSVQSASDEWDFTCNKLAIDSTGWAMPAAGEVISVSFTVELANEVTTTTTTSETTAETTTTTTTTTTVTEPVGNVIRGDVNEDGMLNGFDLAIMRDMLFKEVALVPSETDPNFQRADMNADGSFNIQDAVTLMKFLLG